MTDREQAGLRDRVWTCRTERDYVYPDHHWVMHTEEEFSPAGNLLTRHHLNPDRSGWSVRCEYAENGRIRKKQFLGGGNASEELFMYDSLGRLERVLEVSQGRQRVCEAIQYSKDGTKTQTCYLAPLSDGQRRSATACGPAILHWSADAVTVVRFFDPTGRALRELLYDADDRVIRQVRFIYDAIGQLLEEGELVGEESARTSGTFFGTMPPDGERTLTCAGGISPGSEDGIGITSMAI